jgi:hypothetical protein
MKKDRGGLREAATDLRNWSESPALRSMSDRIVAERLEWAAQRIEDLEVEIRSMLVAVGDTRLRLIAILNKE